MGAALGATVIVPLLFLGFDSFGEWGAIDGDDLVFVYMLAAPLAFATSFLLAWPAYRMTRQRGETWRLLFVTAICLIGPVLILYPLVGEFPWKGGLAGGASAIVFVLTFRLLDRRSADSALDRSTLRG